MRPCSRLGIYFGGAPAVQIQKIVKARAANKPTTLEIRMPSNHDGDLIQSCTGRTATKAVRLKANFSDHDSELVL